MFKAVWSIGRDGFDRIEALRRAAGACPQCISDGKDAYAGHVYVCEETGEPIAAGRMYPDGDALIIDRIAVMPQYDAMPYAELVLRMLLLRRRSCRSGNTHKLRRKTLCIGAALRLRAERSAHLHMQPQRDSMGQRVQALIRHAFSRSIFIYF